MRKMFVIKSFKLKSLFSLLFGCIVVFVVCFSSSKTEFVSIPKDTITITIDAGHGGVDGGSVGKYTKVVESELNLIFAKNLQKQLVQYGFNIIMTRNDGNGLYEEGVKNHKKSDMKKRKQIIEDSNCDLVLSIHMNSYVLEDSCGAQVFYNKKNLPSKVLAESLQGQLKTMLNNTNKKAAEGDYYIVECTDKPAVIIECGFLSNKKEELLLQQKSYQDKFCYAIVCGVISFFGSGY